MVGDGQVKFQGYISTHTHVIQSLVEISQNVTTPFATTCNL
jgi:hypothetical protein